MIGPRRVDNLIVPGDLTAEQRRLVDATKVALGIETDNPRGDPSGGTSIAFTSQNLTESALPYIGRPGCWVVETEIEPVWLAERLCSTRLTIEGCGLWLTSGTLLTSPIIETLADRLQEIGWLRTERRHDAAFVLTELVANAILHGNLCDLEPRDAPPEWLRRGIGIHVVSDLSELAITIIQQGDGRNNPVPPDHSVLPGDPLSPIGRGLFIATTLSDRFEFSEDWRSCTVVFRRAAAEPLDAPIP